MLDLEVKSEKHQKQTKQETQIRHAQIKMRFMSETLLEKTEIKVI